jgi:lysophospholipase L1-like esterase
MKRLLVPAVFLVCVAAMAAGEFETKPNDAYFEKFHPVKAPASAGLILKKDDKLAICGDSITEQRKYSRIIEDYLTMCAPELNATVRQFGWGGEKASGFLARMTNDCLRFKPTIATTCYGMNDHLYRKYSDEIGKTYRDNLTAVVESFKANGVRVITGSPGCVGKPPNWTGDPNATTEDLNLNLCELRNIALDIAKNEKTGFADVFWPMLKADFEARQKYGASYALSGSDGVHPDWAGHMVMAYAFLHAMGLSGDLGTFTMDFSNGRARVSEGHELIGLEDGILEITSSRFPFCLGAGDLAKDDNKLSGSTLVPFNRELNRMMLVIESPKAKKYRVGWYHQVKIFSADQLTKGINLAEEFPVNPFSEVFRRVDNAVTAKQEYEMRQIKQIFRSPDAKTDMEGTVASSEKEHERLAAEIKKQFIPVSHQLLVEPVEE